MVKANCSFVYKVDKNGRYHQDAPDRYFKKGDVIPAGLVPRIAINNPFFIEGIIDDKVVAKVITTAAKEIKTAVEEKKIEPKTLRYTKAEVDKWVKAQEVEFLAASGLTGPEITALRYEADRVKKIMEILEAEL